MLCSALAVCACNRGVSSTAHRNITHENARISNTRPFGSKPAAQARVCGSNTLACAAGFKRDTATATASFIQQKLLPPLAKLLHLRLDRFQNVCDRVAIHNLLIYF